MKWISALLAGVALTACVTTTVENENNFAIGVVTSGDFQFIRANAHTYAWHPDSGKTFLEADMDKKTIRHMFNEAIQRNLAEKGYVRVNLNQSPDFVVGYGVAIESQLSDDELFNKVHMSTGIPADDFHNGEEKGSLLIAMFNYPLLETKWKALAQSGADAERDPEHSEKKIQDYVNTVLKDMPQAN